MLRRNEPCPPAWATESTYSLHAAFEVTVQHHSKASAILNSPKMEIAIRVWGVHVSTPLLKRSGPVGFIACVPCTCKDPDSTPKVSCITWKDLQDRDLTMEGLPADFRSQASTRSSRRIRNRRTMLLEGTLNSLRIIGTDILLAWHQYGPSIAEE